MNVQAAFSILIKSSLHILKRRKCHKNTLTFKVFVECFYESVVYCAA